MNRVAIYARYSTDMQREESIQDQYRNCEKYAEREDWKVVKRYKDEAISGTVKDRPGYQKMLTDAEAKTFDILLIDDLSRLSRDNIETQGVIKRFKFWGIRVIGVSDGIDTDRKGYKIHAGLKGIMNEEYLDDLREKTIRGMEGQALKGFNCGGHSYGYKRIPIFSPSEIDKDGRPIRTAVKKEIDLEQAKCVVHIYQWYAEGYSPRDIAKKLNTQGVPSPRGGHWAQSAIYGDDRSGVGVLNNPLYIGRYIWNRSRWEKDPDTKVSKRFERPESEWIIKEMPELRIVSQELWDRVKARQAEQHKKSENLRKALHAIIRTGAGPKYLFSSLLKCGVCGKNYIIVSPRNYGCASYTNKGKAACGNEITVPRKVVEEKLLEGIKTDLFKPEGLELFKKETSRLLREARLKKQPDQKKDQFRLSELEKEINNMVEAIKAGAFSTILKTELQKAESERKELEGRLNVGNKNIKVLDNIGDILPRAVDRYYKLITDLEKTFQRDVTTARFEIKKLIGDKIVLYPKKEGYLEAELAGDYAGLLKLASNGSLLKINMVAGAGFEPTAFGLCLPLQLSLPETTSLWSGLSLHPRPNR